MKFLLPLLFVLYLPAGCGKKNKVPADILPPKKMEAVLWDMLEADQFLADFVLNKDTSLKKFSESIRLYEKVFHIHKTNKEEFSRSFDYYRSHPALFKEVLDSMNVKKMPERSLIEPLAADDSAAGKPRLHSPLKKVPE